MNKLSKFAVLGVSVAVLAACNQQAAEETAPLVLDTDEKKLSYSMGRTISEQMSQGGFNMDMDSLKAGLDDGYNGVESKVTEEEFIAAREGLVTKLEAEHEAQQATVSADNVAAGETYLAENANKEGVTVTESGLQYKVITAGEGDIPGANDTVSVHYRGTLVDGTEFDSSYSRNAPTSFPVNAVIPGWTEALQLMPVGSKWELAIPSNLAYGPAATGPIGPDSTLIFEVELLAIEGAEPAAE